MVGVCRRPTCVVLRTLFVNVSLGTKLFGCLVYMHSCNLDHRDGCLSLAEHAYNISSVASGTCIPSSDTLLWLSKKVDPLLNSHVFDLCNGISRVMAKCKIKMNYY